MYDCIKPMEVPLIHKSTGGAIIINTSTFYMDILYLVCYALLRERYIFYNSLQSFKLYIT